MQRNIERNFVSLEPETADRLVLDLQAQSKFGHNVYTKKLSVFSAQGPSRTWVGADNVDPSDSQPTRFRRHGELEGQPALYQRCPGCHRVSLGSLRAGPTLIRRQARSQIEIAVKHRDKMSDQLRKLTDERSAMTTAVAEAKVSRTRWNVNTLA